MALKSSINPLCVDLTKVFPRVYSTLMYCIPIRARKLSTCWRSGNCWCLNPKPQALTKGATVMSKASSVSLLMVCERVSTCINILLASIVFPWLKAVTVECLLNMENSLSTLFNSAIISLLRSLSYWYVA